MGHLADALERAYRMLGLDAADGGDVFRHLVLPRIVEPSRDGNRQGSLCPAPRCQHAEPGIL